MTRNKMGKFTIELYPRYGFGTVKRQFVHHTGKPHAFRLVVEIQPPHGVGYWFLPEIGFLGQWPLMQVDQGGSYNKVIVYLVIHMHAHHGLGLQVKRGVVLQRYIYGGSRVEDTFVYDLNAAQGIIYGVIHVFGKRYAAGGNPYRTLGNIKCIERYF